MEDKENLTEKVFHKSDSEMSDMERMMADIIRKGDNEQAEKEKAVPAEPVKSAAPVPPQRRRDVYSYAKAPEPESEPVPVTAKATKKSAATKSKRRSTPKGVMVLIVVLIVAAIAAAVLFFGNLISGGSGLIDNAEPTTYFPDDMVIPSPEAGESTGTVNADPATSIVILSDSPEPTAEPEEEESATEPVAEAAAEPEETSVSNGGHGVKTFYKADVSWSQAREDCSLMGGHLVTISDAEELQEVTALAEANGVDKVWIGCHRENGALVWENGENIDIDSLNAWGVSEPSYYDMGDNVAEDYILLWKYNGQWVFNDSRDDPVSDYPGMYRGTIGYILETDE